MSSLDHVAYSGVPLDAPSSSSSSLSSSGRTHPSARLPGENDQDYASRMKSRRTSSIIHAIGWLLAACVVIYLSDFIRVIQFDMRVQRTWLLLGSLTLFGLILDISYMAFWLPYSSSRPIPDLYAYAPTAVHIGAALSVATFFIFLIALWPVWGFITPVILLVMSFAACFAPNLSPF